MDYNVTYRQKDKGIQAIISYKDTNGKWKQKSKQGFKTQKAAKPWIEETVDDLNNTVKYIDVDRKNDTFEIVLDAFIKHSKLYNQPNTIKNYLNAKLSYKNLLDLKINDITSIDIQACVDEMVKKGLMATTIDNHVVKLKTIFKYAITHRVIKENPVINITMPKDKTKINERVKALTDTETIALLNKIEKDKYYRYWLISLVAVTCGLRVGEMIALKWSDIEEKDLTLVVNKQWKLLKQKPETYGEGIVKRPNSNRTVPIPQSTLDELKKFKANHPIDISGRIFAYKNTNAVSTSLREYYKRIGYKISVHDLRHTYVSRLVANGLDFQTIAALIGDSVEITIKTYSHFTNDMMDKAKRAIASIF